MRQVQTLLEFAKTTSDPKVATALVDKATELKSRADKTIRCRSSAARRRMPNLIERS